MIENKLGSFGERGQSISEGQLKGKLLLLLQEPREHSFLLHSTSVMIQKEVFCLITHRAQSFKQPPGRRFVRAVVTQQ